LNGLSIPGIRITDLTPIKELPRKRLRLDYHPEREAFVQSFPGLEFINDKSAAEFWKEVSGKKIELRTHQHQRRFQRRQSLLGPRHANSLVDTVQRAAAVR
jgi:hypothetical protein